MKRRMHILINENYLDEHNHTCFCFSFYDNESSTYYQCLYPDGGCRIFPACTYKQAEEMAKGFDKNSNVIRHWVTMHLVRDKFHSFETLMRAIDMAITYFNFKKEDVLFGYLDFMRMETFWVSARNFDVITEDDKIVDHFISEFATDEDVYLVFREDNNVKIESVEKFRISYKKF